MADIQRELEIHQRTWTKFIKSSFWAAGACVFILALLWLFVT